ncbi:MAG: restriction endonuclease subunit S [Gordonia sp. (in: high G+C Gram-positive bacteria)]|uniref:restriction endonuclease subunit S n=1 Tax=Gordonia sp. (in: high G+C Gram-positive bacteria) TaxID=84139 RepID=UPI0039E53C6A
MTWETRTLADVVTLKRGFDLATASRIAGAVPILSAGSTAGTHNEAKVRGPGFSVGRATNLGVPQWSDVDYWPLNTTLYAADFHGNNPRWLYHLFQVLDLKGYDSGSVQPMLNRNYIAQVPVSVPPRPVQDSIAEFLGALDDKISANARARDLTMQLSDSIVRAKLLEDSRAVSLTDIASEITRGIAPKYAEEGILVLNQKCVRGGLVEHTNARYSSASPKSEVKFLRRDDVLVNSTGQGTLGRVARWTRGWPNATVDSHVSIVRFDPSLVDPVFAGTVLAGLGREIEALAEGSTGQTELRRDLLGSLPIRLPTIGVQREVGSILSELSSRIDAVQVENEVLTRTRDELLPLLMDGRITVRSAGVTGEPGR